MKTLLAITLLSVSLAASAQHNLPMARPGKPAPAPVVWCGVDYSLARFCSANGFRYGFDAPGFMLPGILDKWNEMFIEERLEDVANMLGRRVSVDASSVAEHNRVVSQSQVIFNPSAQEGSAEPQIAPTALTNFVKTLKVQTSPGVGLVFVVDKLSSRLMPPNRNNAPPDRRQIGVVHVVFFDLSTRQILVRKLAINAVGIGGNFRNFWFGPIKDATEAISAARRKIK